MKIALMKPTTMSRVGPNYPHPCSTSLSGLFPNQIPDLFSAAVRPDGHPSKLWEDQSK
jgi:hypothetical protein